MELRPIRDLGRENKDFFWSEFSKQNSIKVERSTVQGGGGKKVCANGKKEMKDWVHHGQKSCEV